jgi:hypothetical protein
MYRVIHKSLRKFRTRLRNNLDRHVKKEHINRQRISQSFLCTRRRGVLAGFATRGQSWRNMAWTGNMKAFCVLEFAKLSQLSRCNGGFGPCTTQNHLRTKQFVSGTWNSRRMAACALRNEQTAGAIGRDGRVCARNFFFQEPSEFNTSSTCKVGQKIGVSLPLLTRPPSEWSSQLLYRRGWKSRRDLRIAL